MSDLKPVNIAVDLLTFEDTMTHRPVSKVKFIHIGKHIAHGSLLAIDDIGWPGVECDVLIEIHDFPIPQVMRVDMFRPIYFQPKVIFEPQAFLAGHPAEMAEAMAWTRDATLNSHIPENL